MMRWWEVECEISDKWLKYDLVFQVKASDFGHFFSNMIISLQPQKSTEVYSLQWYFIYKHVDQFGIVTLLHLAANIAFYIKI